MVKKDGNWERCNTCWTCRHRKLIKNYIHCSHPKNKKKLSGRDIIFSQECPFREKEK